VAMLWDTFRLGIASDVNENVGDEEQNIKEK